MSLGLNFIPKPIASSKEILLKEFEDFSESLRKRKFLVHTRKEPIVNQSNLSAALHKIKKPFSYQNNSSFSPTSPIEQYISSTRASLISAINKLPKRRSKDLMLSYKIKKTIKKLQNNNEIIIKPSDKNLGICIMDRDFFFKECLKQLEDETTYLKLVKAPDFKGILMILKRILFKFKHLYNKDNSLTTLARTLLHPLLTNTYKIGKFYILPKVHKPVIVGRLALTHSLALLQNF